MGWIGIVIGALLVVAGLWQARGGGWRLALVGGMQASLGAAILLQNGPGWMRYTAWGVMITLTLIAFATTSYEAFRRTRLELSLAALVVVLIWVLTLVSMPRSVELALLWVLLLLTAAFLSISLGRAFGLLRGARTEAKPADGV